MRPEVSPGEVARGRSILLVGTDPDRAVFLEQILEHGATGAPPSIDAVGNATDAVNALESGTYDVIVLDLNSPMDAKPTADAGAVVDLHDPDDVCGVRDATRVVGDADSLPGSEQAGSSRAGPGPLDSGDAGSQCGLALMELLRSVAGPTPIVVLVDPDDGGDLAMGAVRLGADDVIERADFLPSRLERSIVAATHRRAEVTRLTRRVQDLELFTRTAAHDIHAPLRTMNLVVEMLVQGDDGRLRKDQVECLLALRNQVHKLDVLSDGLLQLATLGRGCLRLKPVPIDDVVSEVADLVGSKCDEYLHYGPMPTVLADRTLLVSLLHNLVDNGLRYVRNRAPNVWIRAMREGERIRVEVTDSGIGIPEHQREKVFLPFVRGAAVNESPGHGLGLAMCRRITELHGGSIWIEDSSDQGTTVAFTLPTG